MKHNINKILESIDVFNEEARILKEFEYEFFQVKEKIFNFFNHEKYGDNGIGNKTKEAYNIMLGTGFELLLHTLNYEDYYKLLKDDTFDINEDFVLKLKDLSLMTKEKLNKYTLLKNTLEQRMLIEDYQVSGSRATD